jgi:hypothetical protein
MIAKQPQRLDPIRGRTRRTRKMGPSVSRSIAILTCPHCGNITEEPMPLLSTYTCAACSRGFAPIKA